MKNSIILYIINFIHTMFKNFVCFVFIFCLSDIIYLFWFLLRLWQTQNLFVCCIWSDYCFFCLLFILHVYCLSNLIYYFTCQLFICMLTVYFCLFLLIVLSVNCLFGLAIIYLACFMFILSDYGLFWLLICASEGFFLSLWDYSWNQGQV